MALMIIRGIVLGPKVMTNQPDMFWGIIASTWIGNLLLIALKLPLIGIWVKLLKVPYLVLFPIIMAMCSIGVYLVGAIEWDRCAVVFFGVLGYVIAKLRCEPAPLMLGFVLGPLLEENLRRTLMQRPGRFHGLCEPTDQRDIAGYGYGRVGPVPAAPGVS